MAHGVGSFPEPVNEPVLSFAPGTAQRDSLQRELDRQQGEPVELPLIIGGRAVRTGRIAEARVPHRLAHVLATVHQAGEAEVVAAIEAARAAKADWAAMSMQDRGAIFLRAADLLAGPWRDRLNAATMLNQSKTCHQAEIDAACELIDFFRFNVKYMERLIEQTQPDVSPRGTWNRVEARPLEGFVYAVTPFNFTSIAGNLPHAPALMGNTVIWKPSPHALYSNALLMQLFEEAGLPPGVINFVTGDAEMVTRLVLSQRDFAGLHYTGSTAVFRSLWRMVGANLDQYRDYPRLVGETGGKDFLIAHESADADAVVAALIRGAYEFQGQKCSALSRAYLPRLMWSRIRDRLVSEIGTIRMGDVTDFGNFMGAVIHRQSFEKCAHYIGAARESKGSTLLAGGGCDGREGWFVQPTLIEARDPQVPSMCEEIFGPVLSVHVYDGSFEEALALVDRTSPYGLTGAVFANDRRAIATAAETLRYSAGNFYVNDKPTGAVVGQQPFGGARASGTNDKAGSALNLLRWTSVRTIKENFDPPRDYRMPYME
ncbi:MAG: L-glutamate gamma-semialdehyde dehydrogenase [Phycisphaerales bacterium]|nr:L-glutamate gamma-semialdehyde dehydrogenase [Phycisphaerales bacterium]